MTRQKRKILLFVDNCPAHPHIPEFQVCHSTVPATKHNFKHTTDGPGYRHELQAELPSPSNFKVDRQPWQQHHYDNDTEVTSEEDLISDR